LQINKSSDKIQIQINQKSIQNIKEYEERKRQLELKSFEEYILKNLENLDQEDRH